MDCPPKGPMISGLLASLALQVSGSGVPGEVEGFLAEAARGGGSSTVVADFPAEQAGARWFAAVKPFRGGSASSQRQALAQALKGHASHWAVLEPVAGDRWKLLRDYLASEEGGWRYSSEVRVLFSRSKTTEGASPSTTAVLLASPATTRLATPAPQLRDAWGRFALEEGLLSVEDLRRALAGGEDWVGFDLAMKICSRLAEEGRPEDAANAFQAGLDKPFSGWWREIRSLAGAAAAVDRDELVPGVSQLLAEDRQHLGASTIDPRISWFLEAGRNPIPVGPSRVRVGEQDWGLMYLPPEDLKWFAPGEAPEWLQGALNVYAAAEADHWQSSQAQGWAPWGRATGSAQRDLEPGSVWSPWEGSSPAAGILLVNRLRAPASEENAQPARESDGSSLVWFTVPGPDPQLSWPEAREGLLERAAIKFLAARGWAGEKIIAALLPGELWSEVPSGLDWSPGAPGHWRVGLDETRLVEAVAGRLTLEGTPVRVAVAGWESTGLNRSDLMAFLATSPRGAPQWQWVAPTSMEEEWPDLTIHAELAGQESGEEPSRIPGRTKAWSRISIRLRFETRWGPDLDFQVTGPQVYGQSPRLRPEDLLEQAPDIWSAWLTLSLNQEKK